MIDYLSHNDDICYTALYYEVDDTTLFAVKVAKEKQRHEAQIRRQREKENIRTADSNDENAFDDDDDNDNTATDVIPPELRPHNNEGTFWEPHQQRRKSQPVERLGNYISDDMLKGMNERSFWLHVRTRTDEESNEQDTSHNLDNVEDKIALGELVSAVTDGKELKKGTKILLAVAWCRKDERRLFEMFPEVLMFDVTHSTNTEARPLGLSASIDHNMKVFTPFRVFMPSECQW